jgi:hypothetical protein
MELERSGNVRAATIESPEESIEELVTSKKITIARNKAGRKAFMNNAPVDNFGTKEYQYVPRSTPKLTHSSYEWLKSQSGCILGDVTVKVDCSALMKSLARNGSPHFPASLDALPANTIASAVSPYRTPNAANSL